MEFYVVVVLDLIDVVVNCVLSILTLSSIQLNGDKQTPQEMNNKISKNHLTCLKNYQLLLLQNFPTSFI